MNKNNKALSGCAEFVPQVVAPLLREIITSSFQLVGIPGNVHKIKENTSKLDDKGCKLDQACNLGLATFLADLT